MIGHKASEVDDLFDTRLFGTTDKIIREEKVQIPKITLGKPVGGEHRMHHVNGLVTTTQRILHFGQREKVTQPPFGIIHCRVAGHPGFRAGEGNPIVFICQGNPQTRPDKPAGTCNCNGRFGHSASMDPDRVTASWVSREISIYLTESGRIAYF